MGCVLTGELLGQTLLKLEHLVGAQLLSSWKAQSGVTLGTDDSYLPGTVSLGHLEGQ